MAVRLFETCYLSFFGAVFPKSLWTNCRRFRSPVLRCRVADTDSWLSGSSLGAFPSQPITVWRCPFMWRHKKGEEWRAGGSRPHSESCPWPVQNLDPLRSLARNSGLPVVFPWLPRIILVWKLCLLKNPLKSKPLYTFSLTLYFPGACRSTLVCYIAKKHLFIGLLSE